MKSQNGFTLIETLIYLGLFGLIMVGVVVTAYAMFESVGRTQTKGLLTAEGNFLLGKINWAMDGATAVSVTGGNSLTATRSNAPTSVTIDLTGTTNLELQRNTATPVVLNNPDLKVQNLNFTHTGSGVNPESLTATFDLTATSENGKTITQNFTTTKYVHK